MFTELMASGSGGGGSSIAIIGAYGNYQTRSDGPINTEYMTFSTQGSRQYDHMVFNKACKGYMISASNDKTAFTLNNVTLGNDMVSKPNSTYLPQIWEFNAQSGGTIDYSGSVYYDYEFIIVE